MRLFFITLLALLAAVTLAQSSFGHVPYFEPTDFTKDKPFRVQSIEQSIAVYAWLKREKGRTEDIDVYTFTITKPTRVFVQCLVPVRNRYERFLPAFAVVGPGLPAANAKLPFEISKGQGTVVMEDAKQGRRPTFHEPFGGKSYYRGPTFDQVLEKPGTYHVYYWDPDSRGGDYVAVLGYKETWGLFDVLRALVRTPMIRWNLELHDEK